MTVRMGEVIEQLTLLEVLSVVAAELISLGTGLRGGSESTWRLSQCSVYSPLIELTGSEFSPSRSLTSFFCLPAFVFALLYLTSIETISAFGLGMREISTASRKPSFRCWEEVGARVVGRVTVDVSR